MMVAVFVQINEDATFKNILYSSKLQINSIFQFRVLLFTYRPNLALLTALNNCVRIIPKQSDSCMVHSLKKI